MSKRRTPGKPGTPQADAPVKITLTLPVDLARKFGVHAEMTGQSKSELFAELVRAGCRKYVVHEHGRETSGSGESDAA
jgi:metal-responsive CopG/Arc/MetJ family transcriptional regulator